MSEDLSIGRVLIKKKYGGTGLIFEKTEALYSELNGTADATTSGYFATGDFLQYIYSVLMSNNHQKIQSRCLAHANLSKLQRKTICA